MTAYSRRRLVELINTYDILHASRLEQEEIVDRKFWNEEDTTDDEAVLDICISFEKAALKDAARTIYMYSMRTIDLDTAEEMVTGDRTRLNQFIA